MSLPLVVRLLLDAQQEFAGAADAVPEPVRDTRTASFNSAAWVVAHTGRSYDWWINADAWGGHRAEWSMDWPFDTGRAALSAAFGRGTAYLTSLTDDQLDVVPSFIEGAWPDRPTIPDTTVGFLVARAVAHLFGHAAELIAIGTAAGGPEHMLPGAMDHTRGKLFLPSDVGRPVRIQFYDREMVRHDISGVLERIEGAALLVRCADDRLVPVPQERVRFGKAVG